MTTPNIEDLMARLRGAVQQLRRTSMPIADLSPMLTEAADFLQSQAERIKELEAYNRTRTDELVASVEQCAGLRAKLAALQSDDDLPEPINRDETEHGTDYYTADQLRQHAAQVRAKMVPLEKDAARYLRLRDYLISDRVDCDDAIVDALTTEELDAAIDALPDGITGEPK